MVVLEPCIVSQECRGAVIPGFPRYIVTRSGWASDRAATHVHELQDHRRQDELHRELHFPAGRTMMFGRDMKES